MLGHRFATGAVALVTGAAGGIGQATARRYAAAEVDLAVVDVDGAVEQLAGNLRSEYPQRRITAHVADLTDEAAVHELAAAVRAEHGRLDHLALVAGVLQAAAAVEELPPAEWERVLRINLTAPFLISKEFVPLLKAGDGGTLVAVSSWWGRSGHALFSSYCASKAALIVLVQSLAAELAPRVRANTVCPGNINTSMHLTALATEAEERDVPFAQLRSAEWDKIPMGVAGEPETIADAVLYLSSPASSYVTGASLDVNGGVLFH